MKTNDSSSPLNLRVNTDGVSRCYDILDLAQTVGGISDFTDGMYHGNYGHNWRRYLQAQSAQARHLLNCAGCEPDTHILDVGMGYGRIMLAAIERGARATGISVSEAQVKKCADRNLNVRLMSYRDAPQEWNGRFDGIIANGSAEHFVQPFDAAAGWQEPLYREMFQIMHRLLKPGGKFVTTIIHFRDQYGYSPMNVMTKTHPKGSTPYHFKSLFTSLPGWYPVPGQLKRCATPLFELLSEVDGTEDYHHTSEFWLRQIRIKFSTDPRAMAILVKALIRRDWVWKMINCWAFDQSWAWQFRHGPNGEPPPTILYRQTWKRRP